LSAVRQTTFTVGLDDYFARDTGEIDDIAPDGMLSAKLETAEGPIAESFPEKLLGGNDVFSK
jgi:hypothetical protein